GAHTRKCVSLSPMSSAPIGYRRSVATVTMVCPRSNRARMQPRFAFSWSKLRAIHELAQPFRARNAFCRPDIEPHASRDHGRTSVGRGETGRAPFQIYAEAAFPDRDAGTLRPTLVRSVAKLGNDQDR